MPKVVRSSPPEPVNLERLAQEYKDAKAFAEKAQERADSLKKMLTDAVEAAGTPDERGNLWLDAGPYELKRERRVSKNLDQKAALEWLEDMPTLSDSCIDYLPQVNEDRLLAVAWEIPDLADPIGALYRERVTWAFRLVEKKTHDLEEEE